MSKIAKKIIKPVGKLVNAIPGGSTVASVLASLVGLPQLVPFIQGASTTAKTGSLGAGIGAGLGSFVGGKVAGNIFGDQFGTVGDLTRNVIGDTATKGLATAANSLGGSLGSLASTPISTVIGGYAGNTLGANLLGSSPKTAPIPGFSPSRQGQQGLPESLTAIGGLNPNQQASNLATQGVYGGGLGPQEQSYFMNLVNRRLVDEGGQTQGLDQLNPIENSYLSQLGYGGYQNPKDLLEALSKWKAA